MIQIHANTPNPICMAGPRAKKYILLLALLAGPWSLNPSPAQVLRGTEKGSPHAKRPPPQMSQHIALDRLPPGFLISLPPGGRFLRGYQDTWEKKKPVTFVQAFIKYDPAALLEWYKKTLEAQGWKANAKKPAGQQTAWRLFAARRDATCSILLTPIAGKPGEIVIMITVNGR